MCSLNTTSARILFLFTFNVLEFTHVLFPSSNRRPGEDSDAESSRETSSDGSSDHGIERGTNVQGTWSQQKVADANIQSFNRLALRNNFVGSSSDESDTCNPLGHLIFEYLEHDPPFGREPLADKASPLSFTKL